MNDNIDVKPLISLVMIVKNEAKSIRQTIASVKDQIDSYAIVDTGSTDGTVELAREALEGISGQIVNLPFVDYATTRNASLELAEKSGVVFALVLSGDETFVDPTRSLRTACEQFRDEGGPSHDAYKIQMDMDRRRFDSVRLARLSAGWRYVGLGIPGEGVIHEVLMKEGVPPPRIRIPNCYIHHAETDPARKRSRLYKDLEILRNQIRRTPSDPRSWFYAARTLEQLGLHAQAHEYYKRRVQLGGWAEEQYEAAFHVANTALVLQHPWPDIQQMYLDAYAIDPRRAEPLYQIAFHWSQLGNHALAWMFASRGAAMRLPDDCSMILQKDVYDWQLADIAGISGYYVGEYELGEKYARQAMAACPHEARIRENVMLYEKRTEKMETAERVSPAG